jgi:molybdenum cofactor synthesis domain-containing protein
MFLNTVHRASAGAIIIGNEILSGKITDKNTPLLIQSFRRSGIRLDRVVILPDEKETISNTVRDFSQRYDLVITSGGVGPTHDDITMESVAYAFDEPLVDNEEILTFLEERKGHQISEGLRRIARVPSSAQLLWGISPRWPVVYIKNVHMLPGVPSLFARCLETLCEQYAGAPFICHNVFVRVHEDSIVQALEQIVAAFPTVDIGSYPRYDHPDYKVRLTLEGESVDELNKAVDKLVQVLGKDTIYRIDKTGS